MKLLGAAKAAFLAKMAAGRRRAAAGRSGPRKRRRRNPELLTIYNPARSELAAAEKRYREFHGVAPEKVRRIGAGKGVLIALGTLKELVYQPRRGHRRGPAFFHRFGPGAVLAASVDGREVRIVKPTGRPVRVKWDRGITG